MARAPAEAFTDRPSEVEQVEQLARLAAEVAELRHAVRWLAAAVDDWRELEVARGQARAADRDPH